MNLTQRRFSSARLSTCALLRLCAVALCFGVTASAVALTIVPTYDLSITGDPNASTIINTINQAIAQYSAGFSDPITIPIKFQETTAGLGSNSSWISTIAYSTYRSQLVGDATTGDDTVARSTLPIGANNPADSTSFIWVKFANLRAIGINPGVAPDGFDGTISLNTSIMNLTRPPANGSKYDLQAVAQHEIDEVLAFGSGLNLPTSFPRHPMPEDFFRYVSAGVAQLFH